MENLLHIFEDIPKCSVWSVIMVIIDVFVIIMLVSILRNDEHKK